MEDRRQTQRVGHGSLPFEICIEYVVTGERVGALAQGCGYKQGEWWKLREGVVGHRRFRE